MVEPRNPIIADADTGHGGITATMKSHVGRWGALGGEVGQLPFCHFEGELNGEASRLGEFRHL